MKRSHRHLPDSRRGPARRLRGHARPIATAAGAGLLLRRVRPKPPDRDLRQRYGYPYYYGGYYERSLDPYAGGTRVYYYDRDGRPLPHATRTATIAISAWQPPSRRHYGPRTQYDSRRLAQPRSVDRTPRQRSPRAPSDRRGDSDTSARTWPAGQATPPLLNAINETATPMTGAAFCRSRLGSACASGRKATRMASCSLARRDSRRCLRRESASLACRLRFSIASSTRPISISRS